MGHEERGDAPGARRLDHAHEDCPRFGERPCWQPRKSDWSFLREEGLRPRVSLHQLDPDNLPCDLDTLHEAIRELQFQNDLLHFSLRQAALDPDFLRPNGLLPESE